MIARSPGHIAALEAEALFRWMRQDPDAGVTLATNLTRLLANRIAPAPASEAGSHG